MPQLITHALCNDEHNILAKSVVESDSQCQVSQSIVTDVAYIDYNCCMFSDSGGAGPHARQFRRHRVACATALLTPPRHSRRRRRPHLTPLTSASSCSRPGKGSANCRALRSTRRKNRFGPLRAGRRRWVRAVFPRSCVQCIDSVHMQGLCAEKRL